MNYVHLIPQKNLNFLIKLTIVESERAFSMAGLFVTKIRSKLSDNTLDAQIFLKAYLANKN